MLVGVGALGSTARGWALGRYLLLAQAHSELFAEGGEADLD